MKFTKEEIETAKTLYDKWTLKTHTSVTFKGFLDSFLKPERKFINVRIEYDPNETLCTEQVVRIQHVLNTNYRGDYKVTELPEVFTREDMVEYAEYYIESAYEGNHCLSKWLSERKSK